MSTLLIDPKNAMKAYNEADESGKKLLSNLFGNQIYGKITDRVKTFEDACDVLGLDPSQVLPSTDESIEEDGVSIHAYTKLIIICRALNEGWKPDWKNSSQYKWYPYFEMTSAGFGFSYSGYDDWITFTLVGSRLCFKTSELAEYAGRQFQTIYNDFLNLQ